MKNRGFSEMCETLGITASKDEPLRRQLAIDIQTWTVLQLAHTEQAAMLCCSATIRDIPSYPARLCLSFQMADEAKHGYTFLKYLLGNWPNFDSGENTIECITGFLLDDSRWDVLVLGMQLAVESSALLALSQLHDNGVDPLLKQICRYVMADEARHVSFGSMVLPAVLNEMTAQEIQERQEIAVELVQLVRQRYRPTVVVQRFCETRLSNRKASPADVFESAFWQEYEQKLTRRFMSLCFSSGLSGSNGEWLHAQFELLGLVER
jgi:hypothetical protein